MCTFTKPQVQKLQLLGSQSIQGMFCHWLTQAISKSVLYYEICMKNLDSRYSEVYFMVRYEQLRSMFQVHLIYKASTGFGKTQSMPIQWISTLYVNFILVPKVAAAIISLLVNCKCDRCDRRYFTIRGFQIHIFSNSTSWSDIVSCKQHQLKNCC